MAEITFEINFTAGPGLKGKATVAGEFSPELLDQVRQLNDWIREQGGPTAEVEVRDDEDDAAEEPRSERRGNGKGSNFCPIHGVPMKRHERDGEVWYSHRTEDGTWCRGTKARARG